MNHDLTPDQNATPASEGDLLPEYDFSGGVRGKYWAAFKKAIARGHLKITAKSPDDI